MNRIRITEGDHEVRSDIFINYQKDILELMVSYDGKVSCGILVSRLELENYPLEKWKELARNRIDAALPQPNEILVSEYDEIIKSQEVMDQLKT